MLRSAHALPALLLLGVSACFGPPGKRVTPEEYARLQAADQSGSVAHLADDSRQARQLDDEQAQREREHRDRTLEAQHEQLELQHRRERVALEQATGLADAELALHRAGLERDWARDELATFIEERRPLREAEDALSLQAAADALLETREELAQLELMYAGSELGEGTAEIVLQRTRRRLSRDEERHALAGRRSALLRAVELPREQARLELALAEREVSAASAERKRTVTQLEQQAALRDLEHEAVMLERRLAGLAAEALRLEADRRAAEARRIATALADDGVPR